MHKRVCPVCDAAFVPRYGNQVCCSEECKAARRKRLKKRQKRARLAREAKQRRPTAAAERKEKARRRAEFLAARDLAYNAFQVPVSTRVVNGVSIEWRGQPRLGGCAVNHVMVSVK